MSIREVGVGYNEVVKCSQSRIDLLSALMKTVRKIEDRTTEKSAKNLFFFQFPKESSITLNNGRVVDISQVEIDLSDMFRGGISYGGGGSKMMARAMEAIGNCQPICNLPVSFEGVLYETFRAMHMISVQDSVVPTGAVADMIASYLKEGYTHFNIPISLNNHANLVSIIILGDTATLRFYDSLAPEVISYQDRYCPALINYLKSLLPSGIKLEAKDQEDVLHLFDQGGENSSGCGYYSVYTALVLKENEEIRALTAFKDAPLLNQSHDKGIRAELAVRTLLAFGLEKVDLSFEALLTERRDGIFSRISFKLPHLVEQLKPRVTV